LRATIREHKFSLRSEYDITSDIANYTATKAILSLLAELEVRNNAGDVAATISGNFSLFRASYDFTLADARTFQYACEKIFKGVYSCIGGSGESFHLFQHRGLRYSIFKDTPAGSTQIAAITRNALVICDGHEYDLLVNADDDFIVVACMVLALNTDQFPDDNSTVTYDFGNLFEDRKFDESWHPL